MPWSGRVCRAWLYTIRRLILLGWRRALWSMVLAIPGHRSTDFEVAICQAYTTEAALEEAIEMDHDGTAVRQEQRSVESIPSANTGAGMERTCLRARLRHWRAALRWWLGWVGMSLLFYLLAVDSVGKGYDRVLVCRDRDGDSCIAVLPGSGKWSEWAVEDFAMDGEQTLGIGALQADGTGCGRQPAQALPHSGDLYQRLHAARRVGRGTGGTLWPVSGTRLHVALYRRA